MLDSIFSNTTSTVDITQVLLCILISIILGLVIAFTHKKTSRYNKNFLTTIAVLPLLISTIIIMVNGNLGTSMAVLGAFGFVRFRSIPGTSKEILAVLFMTQGSQEIINYAMPCKNTDLFVRLEERLYNDFPKFRNVETFFMVNTRRILRFKTLEENKIKSNDIISLFVNE